MIKKFPNSGIRIMQDVHQIEAFRIPLHVELTELLGFYFDLVQNCVHCINITINKNKNEIGFCFFFSGFFPITSLA